MTTTKPDDMRASPGLLNRLLTPLIGLYAFGLIAYIVLRLLFSDQFWWLALVHNGAPFLFLPLIVLLPLAAWLRARRLVGVLLVGAVVGAVWLVPRWVPSNLFGAEPAPFGTPFQMIALNVFPYNERLDDAIDWLLVQSADVAAVQEIHPDELDRFVARMSEEYEYIDTHAIPAGSRQAVMSHYPIVDIEEIVLEGMPLKRVLIDIDGQQVALYNVHLLMPHRETPHVSIPGVPDLLLKYDETRRNAQIRGLLAAAADDPLPVILAGDFNMSAYSPIYDEIAARYTDAYRHVGWALGATWPGGASEELPDVLPPLLRLDYIFTSPEIEPRSAAIGARVGSDHLPLVADLFLIDLD